MGNNITIDSDISYWGYSARWLRSKLDEMSGDVEVEISSYGGDVFEGISMYNMLINYDKTKGKVTTVVNSHAMSIASLLFLAGSKKKAHENSTIMIHKAWTWLAGNADQLEAEAKVLSGIDMVMANTYSKYMKKDKDEILKVMSSEGWYIGKDQLNATGFVDEFIISTEEIDVAAKSNFKSAMDRFSAKAKEEGVRPNLDDVKVAILECNDGKCPSKVAIAAVPTVQKNDKPANKIQGENMEISNKDIMASEPYAQLVASHEEQVKALKQGYETNVSMLEASLVSESEKVSKLEASMKALPEICAMAIERKADKATLVAMVTAGSMDAAKVALIDGSTSEGAFGSEVGDGESKANNVVARASKLGVYVAK